VNDASWRNLSAVLGVACVVLIVAAGMLLMTGGESAASPSALPSEIASIDQSPDSSSSVESIGPSADVTDGPSAPPEATPTVPANAPVSTITFANMQLDAQNDPLGKPRTFTFITDGSGKIGASFTTVSPSTAQSIICLSFDGGKPSCVRGTHYSFGKAATDTAHSVWVVTMIGYQTNTPIVNVTMSWPSNTPRVTLTHGRFQGSSTAGVSEALNGFTAQFAAIRAGTVGVSASWTSVTADARVTTDQLSGSSSNLLDQQQYSGVQNVGSPGYTYAVTTGKTYRVSLRNLSADSGRPELTATISLP
jgi:hypothetical protein